MERSDPGNPQLGCHLHPLPMEGLQPIPRACSGPLLQLGCLFGTFLPCRDFCSFVCHGLSLGRLSSRQSRLHPLDPLESGELHGVYAHCLRRCAARVEPIAASSAMLSTPIRRRGNEGRPDMGASTAFLFPFRSFLREDYTKNCEKGCTFFLFAYQLCMFCGCRLRMSPCPLLVKSLRVRA